MEQKIYYKRNLPHYLPENAIFFVTFRLANSLPKIIVDELKRENEDIEFKLKSDKGSKQKNIALINLRKKYFAKFDQYLDSSSTGSLWLKEDKIASIVSDAIHYRDNKEYFLYCSTIMPNHVHMLFGMGEEYLHQKKLEEVALTDKSKNLTDVLRDLKKYTAKECNKVLNRSGQFWHRESFDHVVRNSQEFDNIACYIMNNPFKAGLVKNGNNWKWSYFYRE
jgi:REP element-mobilizing transposase RayT